MNATTVPAHPGAVPIRVLVEVLTEPDERGRSLFFLTWNEVSHRRSQIFFSDLCRCVTLD